MGDPGSVTPLTRALHERSVRFVLIGVAGANYYAPAGSASFTTKDRDKDRLFLAAYREALEQLLRREP